MTCEEIGWLDIFPIWKEKLWPNRTSVIEPTTSMKYLGGYDMENKIFSPLLLGIYDEYNIVAVNSLVLCNDGSARSRGLWVDNSYRGLGLAKTILTKTITLAKLKNATFLWTIPRKSALPAYVSSGFIQTSNWFNEGMEYGPNCYAKHDLY